MIKKIKIIDICLIPFMSAMIVLCSYISIPFTVPFTLQTLAVFISVLLHGSVKSFISVFLYLLLGLIGLPVFSSFEGGISALLGPTGGYLIGLVFIPLVYIFFEKNNKLIYKIIALYIGLLLCYISGSLWFYFYNSCEKGFIQILEICVFPYILIDSIKLFIAIFIDKRLHNLINK